ncbi:hypothetical protein [Photobacterium angustum]|uniref:Choline transporter n=1 Tax=Photobacterium angustum TaxID=661 RepID=A0A2S7VW60_PHOAN|nr:hypothetical protein [Photobacterium angustum]PQJ66350.1 hypothetical protein BTO08_02405 [Photobacterium angustum]
MLDNVFKFNMYFACIVVWLLISLLLVTKRKNKTATSINNNVIVFSCLLFTSGLDIGLLLFPLTEFPSYKGIEYRNLNPVSIELGFWGFSVWGFYFLSTYYFIFIEPKIKLFDIKAVKIFFTGLTILTCAFSVNLFVDFFIYYQVKIFGGTVFTRDGIIILSVIVIAIGYALSKSNTILKLISTSSVFLFIITVLLGYVGIFQNNGSHELLNIINTGVWGYLKNFNQFLLPMNNYHLFYLFWWFSWALMVGKFTAQFTPNNLSVGKLFLVMIFLPSLPLIFWFSILYFYSINPNLLQPYLLYTMFGVGILFLINSLSAIFNIVNDMIKSLLSYKINKSSGLLSCLLMILSFTGYSVKSGNMTFLKIDYIGTIVTLFLYFVVILMVRNYIYSKQSCDRLQ